MQITKLLNSALCTAAITTLCCFNASAQTATWTGAVDTDWNNNGNWDIGVPAEGTNAIIGNFTVNYNSPMVATGFAGLTNSGVLNINAGGFNNNFLFANTSSALVTINNGGEATVNGNVGLNNTAGISVELGGVLNVSGSILVGTGPTGDTSGTSDSISRGSVTNNGGTITATETRVNPNNRNAPNYLIINGGVNDLGDLSVSRQNSSSSSATTMRVNDGVVRTTSFTIHANSYTYVQQDGGIFTNNGTMTLQMDSTTGRDLRYVQTAGLFVTPDPNVVVFYPNGSSSSIRTYYYVNGGTNIVGGFQLGYDSASIGTARMWNSANLYIGSQGINWDGFATVDFQLLSGSILGATADWSCPTAPITLGSGAGGTIQCADLDGTPHNITLGGVVGGGALTKTGGGTLTLSGANTYAGVTTISAGTLALSGGGSIDSSVQIIVGNGATFDVSGNGGLTVPSGQTLGGSGAIVGNITAASGSTIAPGSSIGTITFMNGLSEVDNVFNSFEVSSDSNDVVEVVGDLSLSGTNTVSIASVGTIAANTYTLFHYTGSLVGSVTNLMLVGAPGYLTNNASAQTIDLVTTGIRAITNITWVGNALNNDWDVYNLTNWVVGSSLGYFLQGDYVMFDDTGIANPIVNIPVTVNPGSVTVDATGDYTFTGAGSIGGNSGILKTNSGKLTIETMNTYLGATTISGGTISITNLPDGGASGPIGASGAASANLVLDGGTLEYDGLTASTDRGATVGDNSGGIDITNDTENLTVSGIITGTGLLSKLGAGTLTLSAVNTFAGTNVLVDGTLQTASAVSSLSGAVQFDGGTLWLNAGSSSQVYNNSLIVDTTGTIISAAGHNNVISDPTYGSGTLTIDIGTDPAGHYFTFDDDMTAFTGTIIVADTSSGKLRFNAGGNGTGPQQCNGDPNATFDLGNGNTTLMNRNGGDVAYGHYFIGALTGGASTFLLGSDHGGNNDSYYHIGGKNLSTTYAGSIQDGSASGAVVYLIKEGTGVLTLSGNNTYTGSTTISNGVLALGDGSFDGYISSSTSVDIKSGTSLDVSKESTPTFYTGGNQTLMGSGSLLGSLNAAGLVAPGGGVNGGLGTLTVTNDVGSYGTTWIKLDRNSSPNSDRLVSSLSSVYIAGTLVVTNIGAQLHAGDTFTLFSGATTVTVSSTPVLPNYYTWDISNLANNGTIQVTAVLPPPALTNVDFSTLSSGSITLNAVNGAPNGPVTVQTTTNLLSTWTTVTTTTFDGSGNLNLPVTVDPTAPQSYFRLLAN